MDNHDENVKVSKKEANRLLKKQSKDKKKEIKDVDINKVEDENDFSLNLYGDRQLNQSLTFENIIYVSISDINEYHLRSSIRIKARLQNVRKTGKQAFVILRQQMSTLQCISYLDNNTSKQMLKFIDNISRESIVDVKGVLTSVEKPVESCTQSNFELKIDEIFVISRAKTRLNLQIEDAMRPDTGDDTLAKVNLDTKLDNRVLDLRTPTNHAIFSIQAGVKTLFCEYLTNMGFIQLTTPNLISAASEGGANVFEVTYFSEKAYLAQSPQLYKQMAIAADFEKVFIIGPVFRAENSNTHRHLTEFTGLDLEMTFNSHYHEVLSVICQTMFHIFRSIDRQFHSEINVVRKQFFSLPFEFVEPALILDFSDGVAMLRQAGVEMDDFEDLSTTNEKLLGKLVKKKFGTDFYVLDKFPLAVRPFYTMPDPVDGRYSNSYDVFMRGEEIMSGAQRIHDAALLRERATAFGVRLDTIKDYLDCFELGCAPHAGGGIGLERVVMLYLGLDNIRRASLFPRDPKRLRP